jgi:hypothetical protein
MPIPIREVGFYYNLHVNIQSFMHSVLTVKKNMPGAPIMLVTDKSLENLAEYEYIAEILHLPIIMRAEHCTYIERTDPLEVNIVKMYEFFDRMYDVSTKMNTKWVIRMEDDVYLRKPITRWPDTPIAGNSDAGGMGGGSIFDRMSFIKHYEQIQYTYIESKCRENETNNFSADGIMRWMFTEHDYKYSKWREITEDWHDQDRDGAVHHGDKTLYDRTYLRKRGL